MVHQNADRQEKPSLVASQETILFLIFSHILSIRGEEEKPVGSCFTGHSRASLYQVVRKMIDDNFA